MDVQENEIDEARYVTFDTLVFWGQKQDTCCFAFIDKIRCYYPVNKDTWSKYKNKKLKSYLRSVQEYHDRYEARFILQDDFDELYVVRFVLNPNQGIVIFIANIDYGLPNYVLTFANLRK